MTKTQGRVAARAMALVAACMLLLALAACGSATGAGDKAAGDGERCEVRVSFMSTSASLGMVPLVGRARAGELSADYSFALSRSYREAQEAIEQNMVDIAILQPAKAVLSYQHTNGGVLAAGVASIADWTFVSKDKTIEGIESLAGRTVYTTARVSAEGTTLRYVIELAGMTDQVTLDYRATESEIAAAVTSDPTAIGILTEPSLSLTRSLDPKVGSLMTLEDEWEKVTDDGSKLVGFVLVVRKAFAVEHPDVVKEFLQAYGESVEQMTVDPITYAEDAAALGLIQDVEQCESIVDGAQLACYTGEDLRTVLAGYLQMYADYAPRIIGKSLPGDDFYLTDVDALVARYEGLTPEELAAEGLAEYQELVAEGQAAE